MWSRRMELVAHGARGLLLQNNLSWVWNRARQEWERDDGWRVHRIDPEGDNPSYWVRGQVIQQTSDHDSGLAIVTETVDWESGKYVSMEEAMNVPGGA